MARRKRRFRSPEEMVENLDDHKSLERHRFLMSAGKAMVTLANLAISAFIMLYLYSAIKNNEMPKAVDFVNLIGDFLAAAVKVSGAK
jgi:hypothetical protein